MSLWSAEPARWALVLAGGQGERMRPMVSRWLGSPRPKQYCAFAGGRTMLEHTLERAVAASGPERVVTVIDPAHRRFLNGPPSIAIPGRVIEQPHGLDTGPGVFLPLTYVMRRDPEALVAILPSDHFIHPSEAFSDILTEAFTLAEVIGDKIVILSALPDRPESEYGWIMPSSRREGTASRVAGFREKPPADEALALFMGGGLWNTMIVVARAASLWSLAGVVQPAMASVFEALLPFMGTAEEVEAVAAAYRELAAVNFSRDILERAPERIVSVVMTGVAWCDWGRPERVVDSLARLGKKPAFPREAYLRAA